MSTIEGGAVCTDDGEIAAMLRIVRAHGWDRNLSFARQNEIRRKYRINSTFYSRYTFYDLGYNFRSTEINGYLGNIQLRYVGEIIKKRENNFMRMAVPIYEQDEKYYSIKHSHLDTISNFAVPLICRSRKIRDELVKKCDGKIEIRPVVGGDITQQPFFSKYIKKYANMPNNTNTRLIHKQGLYFGNNPEMTNKEMDEIVNVFTKDN